MTSPQEPPEGFYDDDFDSDPFDSDHTNVRRLRVHDRVPPHDIAAESAVLSAVFLARETLDVLVAILSPPHFYSDANRKIFEAFLDLSKNGRPIDILTVKIWLDERGLLQRVGGGGYLAEILDAVPAITHVEDYAKTIVDKYRLREVISTAQRISAEGYTAIDPAAFVDGARSEFDRLLTSRRTSSPIRHLSELLDPALARAKDRKMGVEKPIPVAHPERAQCLAGGYWPGVHFLISGTGAGKSQLAIEDCLHAASCGVPVLYIGLELEAFQVALRFLGERSRVSWSKLYLGRASGEQIAQAEYVAAELRDMPIYTDFAGPSGWPASRLRDALSQLRELHPTGPLMVVLDYLQLVSSEPGGPKELRERIGAVAYSARALSVEFDAALVIVSSTARANYGAMGGDAIKSAGIEIKAPNSDSFSPRKVVLNPDVLVGAGKESGEIEASADSVTVLLRWPARYEGERVVLSVTVKGRAMGASWCALLFDRGTRFVPFSVTQMEDLPERQSDKQAAAGRPEVPDQLYDELVAQAVDEGARNGTPITSANKCEKHLRAAGEKVTREKIQQAWNRFKENQVENSAGSDGGTGGSETSRTSTAILPNLSEPPPNSEGNRA